MYIALGKHRRQFSSPYGGEGSFEAIGAEGVAEEDEIEIEESEQSIIGRPEHQMAGEGFAEEAGNRRLHARGHIGQYLRQNEIHFLFPLGLSTSSRLFYGNVIEMHGQSQTKGLFSETLT